MEEVSKYQQFLDLTAERYSCRSYKDMPVAKDLIIKILEAARLAPSAVNKQPWKFLILDTPELKQVVIDCYSRDWVKTAPVFIVALGDHSVAWHRGGDNKDHTDVDVSIAVEHICLAATSLNLGSCWICNFDADKCRDKLNIPSGFEPVAIIPIGYPADNRVVKKRKPIEEIVTWGAF